MSKMRLLCAFLTIGYFSCNSQPTLLDVTPLMRKFKADTIVYFLNRHYVDLDNSVLAEEEIGIDSVFQDHHKKLIKFFLSSSMPVAPLRSIVDSVRRVDSLRVLVVVDGLPIEDTAGLLIHSHMIKSIDILKPGDLSTVVLCRPPSLVIIIATKRKSPWRHRQQRR